MLCTYMVIQARAREKHAVGIAVLQHPRWDSQNVGVGVYTRWHSQFCSTRAKKP